MDHIDWWWSAHIKCALSLNATECKYFFLQLTRDYLKSEEKP